MSPIDEFEEVPVVSKPNWYVIAATLFGISLLIAIVFGRDFHPQGPISDIRIHNATDHDLQDVVVGPAHYGPIGRGDSSRYQSWGPAYSYAFVSLLAEGTPMLLQPIDYHGESPLGPGRFTYILSIHNGSAGDVLDIAFVKD
jgi:hypothetical protein